MFDEVVSVEVVRHFCHIATHRLGVGIDARAETLVASRVAKRLKLLQLPLDQYLSRLEEDKDCEEVVGFLDFVRPRAPRFFSRWSDHAHLHAKLRCLLAAGQRRFRLWSAGCGSGEEPYAMLLTAQNAIEHAKVPIEEVDLKILATDLSPRALERGKKGVFDEAQVCDVPAPLFRRFFEETVEGVAITSELKAYVVFRRLNLAHQPFPMTGPLQAIFCHEGLSPMVPRARKSIVEAIQALLSKDGLLCTGFDDELADGDSEEDLWQDGLRSLVRPPGHC
jgi:chemotaxis protein methyltransferase CheR